MSSNPFYVRVQITLEPPGLRLRSQPTVASAELGFEEPGALLTVIESETAASLKIGLEGKWIQIRDAQGREGYVAAWYVEPAGAEQGDATHSGASCETRPEDTVSPALAVPTPQELIDAINAERAKNKLPALKAHPALMKSAQKHADYMASGGGITHESADGSRPFQRHLAAGFPLAGDLTRGGFASENIVANPNMTIAEAIEYWYGDDPHTHTMLGDKYTHCGAGITVSGDMIYYCFDSARST